MDKVELFVNGKVFGGWKDVSITRSLNAISGSFSLSVTDRWSGQAEPWIVAPDDECVVKVNGEPVISGYVFGVENSIEKAGRSITVTGRDKTADLVDCSIDLKTTQLEKISLSRLAKLLADPFGIAVTIDVSTGAPFNPFAFNQGETCFEALERACKLKGALLTGDGAGGVLITRPGTNRSTTILEQGQNLLQASASFDHTDRFSRYKVKGQASKFGEDLDPAFSFQVQATATDPSVKRFRPMLIVNDTVLDNQNARTRALWESKNRAAKAGKFKIKTVGWKQADGTLWRPNQLVRVRSSWLGLDDDLLAVTVQMNLSDKDGTTTEINLERKDAYLPEPIVTTTDPLETALRKEVKK